MPASDMCLKIKAAGKCSNGGIWCFFSKQPKINGGLFKSRKEAKESYEKALKTFLMDSWNILPDRVYLDESKIKCSDAHFQDPDDDSSIEVELQDIRITLTYCIREQENRTLDEFDTEAIKCKDLTHAETVVKVFNKIIDLSEKLGVTPETVFEKAMDELSRQKEEVVQV